MMNSPEIKDLLPDFRISDWIKDVLAMLDILKDTKLYVPEDERIQVSRDIELHFTTEEGLYYDKLLKQFQEAAQQVGSTNKGYFCKSQEQIFLCRFLSVRVSLMKP